ncbi:MAG: hypothetical protein WC539_06895 [Nitrospirota bacterium]
MYSSFLRILSLGIIAALLTTGCMLSRGVDRLWIGWTTGAPIVQNRLGTGFFLLPIAFVIDVATWPIQGLLVIILGDEFPYKKTDQIRASLEKDPLYQKLTKQQKELALLELSKKFEAGKISSNTALVLNETGHWEFVQINDETRKELYARAQVASSLL